jgi:hypothetical protein
MEPILQIKTERVSKPSYGTPLPAVAEGHSRPLSPPVVFRAPSGFTSVLFCRVVCSLPLAVPTLPSP